MLDLQLQSIKGFNAANWSSDAAVHFITQRYAQLTTSLLLLNADYQARPARRAPRDPEAAVPFQKTAPCTPSPARLVERASANARTGAPRRTGSWTSTSTGCALPPRSCSRGCRGASRGGARAPSSWSPT